MRTKLLQNHASPTLSLDIVECICSQDTTKSPSFRQPDLTIKLQRLLIRKKKDINIINGAIMPGKRIRTDTMFAIEGRFPHM